MTSGFLRDPTPGIPGSALEAVAHRIVAAERTAKRAIRNAPPRRQVPVFRMDDLITVTAAAGTVDVYGISPTGNAISVLLDVILDPGTYATVTLRDDLGQLAAESFGPGGTYMQQLDSDRAPISLLTVAAAVTAGTGTVKIRARAGYG